MALSDRMFKNPTKTVQLISGGMICISVLVISAYIYFHMYTIAAAWLMIFFIHAVLFINSIQVLKKNQKTKKMEM